MKKKIVIFASGEGSNASEIMKHFNGHPGIAVSLLLCNRPDAAVIAKAEKAGIPCEMFSREDLNSNGKVLQRLISEKPDLIVLAGFLWLIPESILQAFRNKIINIHPALLTVKDPATGHSLYGGKNMYGMNVHRAVLEAGEKETGITIHYVNEHFDQGKIIFTASCSIDPNDTADIIAGKVRELEHRHYPVIIEKLISRKL